MRQARRSESGRHQFRLGCLAVIVCVLVASVVQLVTIRAASAEPVTIAQQIADPSYINPIDTGTWDQLIGSSPGSVGMVVANVLNGPDYEVDSAWTSVIDRAHDAGQKVLGYVDTGYLGTTGRTTRLGSTGYEDWITQAEQDINAWYAFYGSDLGGIFFDDVQNSCGATSGSNAWADTYAQLSRYVKQYHPGALTVDNPGAPVPKCYENAADVLLTFEGSYSDYVSSFTPLSWTPADPKKIWHIVYAASTQSDMENAVSLSKGRNAGYVYVTNDVLDNPYDSLPPSAYWSDEQSQIAPGGSPGTTPPSVPTSLSTTANTGTQVTFGWSASTAPSATLAGQKLSPP